MGGLGFLEEASGVVPAGLCSLATQCVAGYNIHRHLSNYTEPRIQRYMIRIILMVPLYSMSSFFSLAFPSIAFYLTTIRSCYEAYGKQRGRNGGATRQRVCSVSDAHLFRVCFPSQSHLVALEVLYNFMSLCLYYVGGPNDLVMHWETDDAQVPLSYLWCTCCLVNQKLNGVFLRRIVQGVLQFVIVKLVLTVAALILELVGGYKDGSWSFTHGYLYVTIFYNISIGVALYALVVFYLAAEPYLRPQRPLLKFVMVKSVIFVTYWQSLLLSLLFFTGAVQPLPGRSEVETSGMLQNFLICFECLPGAFLSLRGFPPRARAMPEEKGMRQTLRNLQHALSVHDVVQDTEHAFDRKYGQFVMMTSPRDGHASQFSSVVSAPSSSRTAKSAPMGLSDVHVDVLLYSGAGSPPGEEALI